MNTSGGPISKLCAQHKISADELLVIHDELKHIPEGDVRVKVGGGHAGHNGLRSIIDKMGSRDFSRIRVGIGNPPGRMAVADFVLKQFRPKSSRRSRIPATARPTPPGSPSRRASSTRDHVNGGAAATASTKLARLRQRTRDVIAHLRAPARHFGQPVPTRAGRPVM